LAVPLNPPSFAAQAERLRSAVAHRAGTAAGEALGAALHALASGDYAGAVDAAQSALRIEPHCALAWRMAALAHEAQGDVVSALSAYEAAQALEPDSADILADLGRLANGMGLHDVATDFHTRALALEPGSSARAKSLAQALADGHHYDRAVEVLKGAIAADADNADLWNALGLVLLHQGDTDNALIFLEQALRLDPDDLEALYNRASAKLELGDLEGALADCDAALARGDAAQRSTIRFLRALARLCQGDLRRGWADYESRLDPDFAKAPLFRVSAPRWRPDQSLAGRRFLAVGEQGLGDEIMFTGMVGDLGAALGPGGTLILAVQPRLIALMQRSFPWAQVRAHETGNDAGRPVRSVPLAPCEVDLWGPIGSLAQIFRSDLTAFQGLGAYLKPDPARVAHWRGRLAALGDRPKIGIAWKSMKTSGERLKQYPSFEDWLGPLRTPGLQFVNLQYGECAAELRQARDHGIDIWTAPELDLTNDLDEAAALSAALDLMMGVGNASSNLAGACGVPVWLSMPPAAWPSLGQSVYPWFVNSRLMIAERFGDWAPVMGRMADALSAFKP
jgi:tetratricopeptide (TPR) repeat protein